MATNIEIPDSQIEPLIKFYKEEKQKIQAQIKMLSLQESDIDKVISNLSAKKVSYPFIIVKDKIFPEIEQEYPSLNEYNKDWSWPSKIEFILTRTQKAATVNEILQKIAHNFEPQYRDENLKKQAASKLSAVLKMKFDKKSVFTRYASERGIKWGLIDWADENGEIKDQYK